MISAGTLHLQETSASSASFVNRNHETVVSALMDGGKVEYPNSFGTLNGWSSTVVMQCLNTRVSQSSATAFN